MFEKTQDVMVRDKVTDEIINKQYHTVSPGQRVLRLVNVSGMPSEANQSQFTNFIQSVKVACKESLHDTNVAFDMHLKAR